MILELLLVRSLASSPLLTMIFWVIQVLAGAGIPVGILAFTKVRGRIASCRTAVAVKNWAQVRNWALGVDGEELGSVPRESASIDRGNVEHNPLGDIAAISDSATALATKGATAEYFSA